MLILLDFILVLSVIYSLKELFQECKKLKQKSNKQQQKKQKSQLLINVEKWRK